MKAKTIHIAPVANEVPIEVIRKVRNKTPTLSIDPQGFLREFDERGHVKPKKLETLDFLQHFDIYKSAIQEIRLTTGLTNLMASIKKIHETGPKIVLATMGRRGIVAYIGRKFYHIPACEPRKFKDPTGAGDVFIGAFLAESMQGEEPLWCCCVGSAAASFVVEEVGAQHFGEKDAIYERAAKIYDKGIKPLSHNIIV